ncbi:amidohydrolase family protein [Halorubrum persicum]|uniref:amidohydrolase family protein n=1 Tax=Halorubrum persicum TaxID=1383844 RepID=UPI001FE26961|nr:amidohydrolase family protein [Halorubrum persicum]
MTDLLIHDAVVVTMNQENQLLTNGSIRVTDGTISSIAATEPRDRHSTAEHVIDASGKVVIPGLIDAHRHTDFTLVQGLFSELSGGELLKEAFALYHTAEPTLGDSFFEAAWQLACLRQLTHGVTTVNAMDFTPELGAEAIGESGLRGVIGPELADFLNPASAGDQLAAARQFIETYHNSYDGRVTASIAPGGEAGCSRRLWEGVAELRADYSDLRLHTHLYDSAEAETMAAGSGADDPLDLLDRYDLLDERTLLTHLLHADRDDARRIADAGAGEGMISTLSRKGFDGRVRFTMGSDRSKGLLDSSRVRSARNGTLGGSEPSCREQLWEPVRLLPTGSQYNGGKTVLFNTELSENRIVSQPPSIPSVHSVAAYVADGARIAAILLIWSVIAAFFTYGVSEIGGTGGLLETLGPQIGTLVALTGLLNAILFVLYRSIDYWHQYT